QALCEAQRFLQSDLRELSFIGPQERRLETREMCQMPRAQTRRTADRKGKVHVPELLPHGTLQKSFILRTVCRVPQNEAGRNSNRRKKSNLSGLQQEKA